MTIMSLAWNDNGVWQYKTDAVQSFTVSTQSRDIIQQVFRQLLQPYIKKDTAPFSIFVLVSSRLAAFTRGAPQQRIFCEFFSMPGCPVEISSYAFETRVPRSHLINGILDLLPEPALLGCWWLHCSVVISLNTLPPLQKKCQAGELFWRQTSNSSRRWIFISYLRNAEGAFLLRKSLVLKWNNLPNAKFHSSTLQVPG